MVLMKARREAGLHERWPKMLKNCKTTLESQGIYPKTGIVTA
jgi:hypothetical protein